MTVLEIPLAAYPQKMQVAIGGTPLIYTIRTFYNDCEDGGWAFDLMDEFSNPLACGIPLVTGADLIAQFPDLGLPGRLYVAIDNNPGGTPAFDALGVSAHLYYDIPES